KCPLDELRCRSTREYEPEVAIAFGQRHDRTPRRDADVKTNHSVNGEGSLLPRRVIEYARRTNGEHHHARRLSLSGEAVEPQSESVTNDDLFEAHPRSKLQGSRAQAPDRPSGQFEDGHGAANAHAQLD